LRFRSLLLILILLFAVVLSPLAVRDAMADANNPDVIPAFIDAVNRGDANAVMQLVSPNLTVTLPGGITLPVDTSTPLSPSLLPVTIVSLTPEGTGSQTVDGVLAFGSDPTQKQVQFKGDGGVITSIVLLGP
jgi:hypothetical protein